jgi:TatD DNase family protein
MNVPSPDDFIDIHNHGAESIDGVFSVEVLMAHEEREPENLPGITYTYGIHPWYLDENNHDRLIASVIKSADNELIIGIGEAGFETFEEQVYIAEEHKKPVVIHCVRAWDELLQEHKKLKPKMPWLVHGFRGKPDLALQLVAKGMYLSFWFDFILRPESTLLIKSLPADKIFLETDGSGVDIREIYNKVSKDLDITVNDFKAIIISSFYKFFKLKP